MEAVIAANEAFYEAWEAGDKAQLRSMWLDSDDVVSVHPGVDPEAGDVMLATFDELVDQVNGTGTQFFVSEVSVAVVGDVARVVCVENCVTTVPTELQLVDYSRLGTTNLFRRTPDGWRIWHHHAGPVVPVLRPEPEA
ncbi:nuclear transport factor 2 family protein [Nocardioides speluncae]|uniref:nuclear transport factor 2 family protein n=1 Tax=Nocardioides speluncae TaxID=2670337 RepID=UPI0013796758|nr:nuclear transport factor 2 family protein [Nocardioides speluncae]